MQMQKHKNSLISIEFKLKDSHKSKHYLVNTDWSIEQFIENMKTQVLLDAEYFGLDIEKQEEIEFIPSYFNHFFDFSLLNIVENIVNDQKNLPLNPSSKKFKYYFDFHYPSFIIRKKININDLSNQNYFYPYYSNYSTLPKCYTTYK